AWRVVIGTLALEDPALLARAVHLWGERIAVSLDARDGMLATHGWQQHSDRSATEAARWLAGSEINCLIYTDISRDGTLSGPNFSAVQAVRDATRATRAARAA